MKRTLNENRHHSGHGKYIRGAEGPEPWGLDEVDEARKVVMKWLLFYVLWAWMLLLFMTMLVTINRRI